jgi:hypothetical protein
MKIVTLLLILVLFSCSSKKDCLIEPISNSVLDTTKFKGNFVFRNQKGETDTLILLQSANVIQTYSVKSMTNIEECGHTIVFNYDSKRGFGTVGFRLNKDENKRYQLLTNGFCFSREKEFTKETINQNSTFTIKVDSCYNNSKFREIRFKNFIFDNYVTSNGDIWKVEKFIAGNPLYN